MKKIFIIIIILILIGGIFYFLIWRARLGTKPSSSISSQETVAPPPSSPETEMDSATLIVEPLEILKQELTIRARTFIERYGSYSSDTDFANLQDLLPLMSNRLANETKNYLTTEKTEPKTRKFYGLTTRVLSIEIKNIVPDVSANFSAFCQQQETKDKTTITFYKAAQLKMIFENNDWKVDSIEIQ